MFSLALSKSTALHPCVSEFHNPSRRARTAGIMVRSRDTRASRAEQSPPGRRRRRHRVEHSRKRQKIVPSETETRTQIQTLKPNLTRASSSSTRLRTNSHVRWQDVSCRKSHRALCQRKWTHSARDVSKYNGDVWLTYELFVITKLWKIFKFLLFLRCNFDWSFLLCRLIGIRCFMLYTRVFH